MTILKTLRAAYPEIVMDHRQTAHEWGPWYQLAGSYTEPIAGDENPETYGVPIASLHTDHVAGTMPTHFSPHVYRSIVRYFATHHSQLSAGSKSASGLSHTNVCCLCAFATRGQHADHQLQVRAEPAPAALPDPRLHLPSDGAHGRQRDDALRRRGVGGGEPLAVLRHAHPRLR